MHIILLYRARGSLTAGRRRKQPATLIQWARPTSRLALCSIQKPPHVVGFGTLQLQRWRWRWFAGRNESIAHPIAHLKKSTVCSLSLFIDRWSRISRRCVVGVGVSLRGWGPSSWRPAEPSSRRQTPPSRLSASARRGGGGGEQSSHRRSESRDGL